MKEYIIFIGTNNKGKAGYYRITTLEQNDGDSIEGKKLDSATFDKKLFKDDRPGSIHEVTWEGDTAKFNKSNRAVSFWKSNSDVAEWQLTQRSVDAQKGFDKMVAENKYAELLAPIREAYVSAGWQQKQLILAEVIRVVTSGR